MTCIVAIKDGKGGVLMGADSVASSGWISRPRVDPKIYRVGQFLFGFTTSYRMGQLLGHSFEEPERLPHVPVDRFMATSFIDAVRTCLKNGGFARKEAETEKGGVFLVAYQGRIFRVDDDYQVAESLLDFDACGAGEEVALGSLYSTQGYAKEISVRISIALSAAEQFCSSVRSPFLFEGLEPNNV
jgi:hypothetical protein